MKKTITTKILMLFLFLAIAHNGNAQWFSPDSLANARAENTASVIGDKIYVIGGLTHPDSSATTEVNVYNTVTDSWEANAPDLPVPLCGASSCEVNGKIYVTGGKSSYWPWPGSGAHASFYEYDPSNGGTWTTKAAMQKGRFYHTSVVLDGKIYVMGGRSENFPVPLEKTVEVYDFDTDTWSFVQSMNERRALFPAEELDGKIYVMGGASGPGAMLSSVEVYEPQANTWTESAPMPEERLWQGSTVINDLILVFGGVSYSTVIYGQPSIWKFDPSAGTWTDTEEGAMAESILYFAEAAVEGANCDQCIYTFGGGYRSYNFYPDDPPPFVTDAVYKYCLPQPTEVTGGPVNGTWKYSCSPYMINGDISVSDGETLIIEPGVEVIFTDHYRFDIQGQLLAVGTKDSMITFTAQDSVTAWNGLRFDNIPVTNDTSKLVYCKVQYGYPLGPSDYDKYGGGIGVISVDKLLIAFCEIRENRTLGDEGTLGGAAGIGIAFCSPLIKNNLITNNKAQGEGIAGGILIDGGSPLISGNLIANNEAQGDFGGGIYMQHSNSVITNNIIFNNTVGRAGGGITFFECLNPTLINNTVTGNNALYGGGLDFIYTGKGTCINNIIYGNVATIGFGEQVRLSGSDTISFFNCDIEGRFEAFGHDVNAGPPPDFSGSFHDNIDASPGFIDPSGDFHLAATSPCIEEGIAEITFGGIFYAAPSRDYDNNLRPWPVGTPPDIGAFEYHCFLTADTVVTENSISITMTSGVPPFIFSINGNPATQSDPLFNINDLSNGNYKIFITDSNDCILEFLVPIVSTKAKEIKEDYAIRLYPNPFNSSTTIRYHLEAGTNVNIKIFNLAGREVATLVNEYQMPGEQETKWNVQGLPAGIYLYRLQTETGMQTGKCVLQR